MTHYGFLPEKHWFAHDYCMMIHNCLAQVVLDGERARIFNIQIDDPDGHLVKKTKNARGNGLLEALEKEGKSLDAAMLLYRQVFVGILSDMTHFIYEALICSTKGKLPITFSLLRKPLTENLLYLEYLLSAPGDFILNFWKGNIDHFGLGRKQVLNPLEIIQSIYQKYPILHFEDPDFIWEIRYKKNSKQSFQTYFQRATHLVTQAPAYKTNNTNFNFIYSRKKEREGQWTGLYAYLPIILFHAYHVVELLLKSIAKRAGESLDITDARIAVGYGLWEKHSHWGQYGKEDNLNRLREIFDISQFSCSYCDSKIASDQSNYETFYEDGKIHCSSCSNTTDLVEMYRALAQEELIKHSTP